MEVKELVELVSGHLGEETEVWVIVIPREVKSPLEFEEKVSYIEGVAITAVSSFSSEGSHNIFLMVQEEKLLEAIKNQRERLEKDESTSNKQVH